MKPSHHGSLTSSSAPFVRAIAPRVAVFSVQRDNRFGHPHPLVVDRYTALGTHVLRTDAHGAITIRTDGQTVSVKPYIGSPVVLPPAATPPLAEIVPASPLVTPREHTARWPA
ncbi:MAG TPA: MBL fold metallo-hydrolase, partial [Candidatus Tectomicrobia bacterium]